MLTRVQPFPALLQTTATERVLVVADLHIGWEVALAEQGIHVPSQTPKLLKKIEQLIDICRPSTLFFLGDVKHTIAKTEMGEWKDIPDFFDALSKRVTDIRVILGNHDGNLEHMLPEGIKLLPQTGASIGDVGFFHGNAWPAPALFACHSLVMGHVHPTVAFRDPMGFRITAPIWLKAKIDRTQLAKAFLKTLGIKHKGKTDAVELLRQKADVRLKASELFIMPCFNDFLGGRPINRGSSDRYPRAIEYLGPILRSRSADLDNAEIYMLDGTFLGTVRQLKKLG